MTKGFNRRRAPELGTRSIPQLFLDRCAATPDAVAFRYKDLGIYHEVTWREYRDRVETLLAGLEALGLERGDCVAMMSDPCHELYLADMAALCGGAVCYGIYTTCSVPEVEYQLSNGRARFFFAENQEFVDKALSAEGPLPELRKIVVFDTRALFQYSDPRLVPFARVLELGRARLAGQRGLLEARAGAVRPEDVAVLVYTSGTTGPPKGAMHDHATLMWGFGNSYLEAFPELNEGTHRTVSHLPIAHLIERSNSMYLPLVADVVPHAGEEVEDLRTTLHEVQPTFLNVVPRILEKMASGIVTGVHRSSWLKRTAFAAASRIGERYRAAGWEGRRAGLGLSILYALAKVAVFDPMLRKAGLSRIRAVLCAGAALPPKIQALWQIWGVNVRNLYGITEGGYALCQTGAFPRPGDAGRPIFPQQVRLGPDREILLRGGTVFRGYWQNEAATRQAVVDGWLNTGDVAEVDAAGSYRVVDRKKDIMITSGGKNIAPSEIENLLKSSPYVSEAILVGDGRKFVSALVEIDFSTVSEWARAHGVLYTSFTSLATHPEVVRLVEGEIEAANAQLARVEQVKRFRIIPKELDPEEGDTTPTRKVKRAHLHRMFAELIEEMYGDGAAPPPAEADARPRTEGRSHMEKSRVRRWLRMVGVAVALASVGLPAAAATEYRLGYITDLSGPLAGSYTPTWQGFELYVKALNDRGGVNGRKVKLSLDDDGLRADRAVANAKKQAERDGVLGIFGLSLSSTQAPVIAEMEKVGVPLVSSFSAVADALPPAKPGYFSTGVLFEVAGEAIGELLPRIAPSGKVVGMTFDSVGGRAALRHNKIAAEKLGYGWDEVVFPVKTSDFSPFAQTVAAMKPAIVVGHYGAEQNLGVIPALRKAGYDGPYVIASYGASEETARAAAQRAGSSKNVFLVSRYAPATEEGDGMRALAEAAKKHGVRSPTMMHVTGWVLGKFAAEALAKCGDGCTREGLTKAMQALTVQTDGLSGGPIRMTAQDHYGPTFWRLYRWDGDRLVAVGDWLEKEAPQLKVGQGG